MSSGTSESPIDGTRVEFIALVSSMGLYGITCMQTFLYFAHSQREAGDRWPMMAFVIFMWLMDTVHQILTNQGYWNLLLDIFEQRDPFGLSRYYLWAGFFTSLVTLPTQLFFVMRIWKLSKNIPAVNRYHWLVPAIFVPCSLFQFAGYFAFMILCFHSPTAEIIFAIEKLPMAFWGVGAAEDVLISCILIALLRHSRSHDGLRRTHRLIFRLTLFAINTGVWTALCALFIIITMAAYPNIQVYLSLYFVICPLYCNTLLANLNARGYIRGDDSDFTGPTGTTFSRNGDMVFASFPSAGPQSTGATTRSEDYELSVPTFANNSGPVKFGDPKIKDDA
ncbi:hypothetical protein BV20DRAFT_1120534 [Pilatotrama ljubarskyi]|nr:hypothetical protein BV20DRAFT_1120534 [Pilatotrama ljubarskyi]